jgi:hypothetical protein
MRSSTKQCIQGITLRTGQQESVQTKIGAWLRIHHGWAIERLDALRNEGRCYRLCNACAVVSDTRLPRRRPSPEPAATRVGGPSRALRGDRRTTGAASCILPRSHAGKRSSVPNVIRLVGRRG